LQEAARQCADWLKRGVAVPSIAVNVSGVQLQRQDLATLVQEASDAHGLSPSHLQLELTETALVTASHALSDRLRAVRALGATVALDDFGTGYSSMTHLQGLPLDALKIDRRFVGRMASDPGSQAIVEAMVGLARALELEVVAEGVETQTEQAMVLAAGCPCAQGFLFSRPLAPDALEALLAARAGPSLLGPSDPATKGSVLSG
jgi:EAL domain-containing protein (putative c-di-GMP-specific phosphodiesterase class I)